jgi:hypothetical protein
MSCRKPTSVRVADFERQERRTLRTDDRDHVAERDRRVEPDVDERMGRRDAARDHGKQPVADQLSHLPAPLTG